MRANEPYSLGEGSEQEQPMHATTNKDNKKTYFRRQSMTFSNMTHYLQKQREKNFTN
jgi:hypothetical protein